MNTLLFTVLLSSLPLAPASSLGRVEFPVRCTADAQRAFVRGVSALHSFWYEEAIKQFEQAEKADAHCAMAYVAEALANVKLLWLDDDVAAGRKALERIPPESETGPLTAKERAWLGAVRALVGAGPPPKDGGAEGPVSGSMWSRRKAFASAMDEMRRAWPDDLEVAAFDALAILVELPDLDVAHQSRAAALALEVLSKNPEHPGALHYAIHATDTPEMAPLGLPAARAYARTAPESFHARHMPAHIFARLGLWQEALAACESAWDVSEKWVKAARLSPDKRDFHSFGWILTLQLELGQPKAAEQTLARFAEAARTGGQRVRGAYQGALFFFLSATGAWQRLDELAVPVSASPSSPTAAASAGAACHAPAPGGVSDTFGALSLAEARVEAAVARRDVKLTEQRLAEERELRTRADKKLAELLGEAAFARRHRIWALRDQAMLARAKGDDATVAAREREIAALEDQEPPPEGADGAGGAHRLAGEALLRLGRAREAADEFARSLVRYPGHALSLLGAARAAAKAGDTGGARRAYARLAEIWSHAEPGFAPLEETRSFLAAHAGE
jgi:tetratricopeptide (TPR) repeat protein